MAEGDLDRFVAAQHDVYDRALAELQHGCKTSHWMWFVFPQIAGLGHSAMSRRYSIATLVEARDYRAHPILGPRLRDCIAALDGLPPNTTAEGVLGGIDAIKLRSSLTLFEAAGDPAAAAALDRWFGGGRDPATTRMLAG